MNVRTGENSKISHPRTRNPWLNGVCMCMLACAQELSVQCSVLLWCGRDLYAGIFAEVKPGRNAISGFFSITNISNQRSI